MNLRILHEDEHVIVCYKPAGLATQTAKMGAQDMESLLKNYLYKKEKKMPYVAVIHRLDQPVEGILVFAKTPFAAKELNKGMQGAGFGKYYKAVVCGIPNEKKAMLEDYLVKDGKTNTSRVGKKDEAEAKKAVLAYEVIQQTDDKALLKIKLETGRHHQIRVQMANMGCPIWGDTKYNSAENVDKSWKNIALCAYHLEFVHPKTKKKMVFEIEPEGEGFVNMK
jgi:23S rRNA pseudouridine1911/1915/1917 synthase